MLLHASIADTDRWTAVLERDSSADGRFVYAVASTRIYCRPSCPSRRPNRRQVSFFPTPDAAEAEGFRACRRCHPRNQETEAIRRVREAQRYLDRHLDETVTLDRLGRAVGLSPYHLQRTFKRLTGMSPRSYAGARRMERMKQELKNGGTVSRATYDAGYASPSRAYDESSRRLGMTPGSYQRGGRGVHIRFTTVDTALGTVLVAATDRGLCSVTIGASAAVLEADLRREFPAARLERRDTELRAWAGSVVARLAGEEAERLPLDVSGTPFQWQVWEALQRIPRGVTRSYTEIARAIGRPTAARAVARACASNKLALVIPCHRVVREDGDEGGYRWGVARKRELLKAEREKTHGDGR
ncbi:MAG TPA: bifunctional DNA-binding transcriptional regulator/O6-methylguanine-DNA methyltransferase Ada [Gemmatimonadales bacterium]|nr:bifunctional DNA-binding transcriptional regulator/O6-methylguanine-DNA methyltransferase Ada [Gemmatimonadales bacterium]